jgi:hypothetical protein
VTGAAVERTPCREGAPEALQLRRVCNGIEFEFDIVKRYDGRISAILTYQCIGR